MRRAPPFFVLVLAVLATSACPLPERRPTPDFPPIPPGLHADPQSSQGNDAGVQSDRTSR